MHVTSVSWKKKNIQKDRIGLWEKQKFSHRCCKNTEFNMDIINSFPLRWKRRIKILRYEDVALNPSKRLPGLLEFAGLPFEDSLIKWLYLASHKPKTESEQTVKGPAPWRLDASEGANKLRWKVTPYERACRH